MKKQTLAYLILAGFFFLAGNSFAANVDEEINCAHEINPKCRHDKILRHSSDQSNPAPEESDGRGSENVPTSEPADSF